VKHRYRRLSPPELIFLIFALAVVLRMAGVFSRPIWYDEAFAILFSRQGLERMIYGTLAPDASGAASDVHPLGYYFLLSLWMQAFGESIAAARLLSILIGIGLMTLGLQVARSIGGHNPPPLIAFLIAVSPFQIHFAQEVRMYGLLTVFLLGATLAVWAVSSAGRRWWQALSFGLCAAGALYTHNLAIVYLLPLALIPLLRRNFPALGWTALGGLFGAALYLPWALQLPAQFEKLQNAYWTVRPGIVQIFTTLIVFTTNLPLPTSWLPVGLFVSILLLSLTVWQTLRLYRLDPDRARPGLWLAYLALVPCALLFLVSQWMPVYIDRALLPSAVLYLAWVGWALIGTGLPTQIRSAAIALFCLGAGMGIYQHLAYQGFPYAPYHELNASIEAEILAGDAIVHSNKLSMLSAYLDSPELPHRYIADPLGSGSDTLAGPTQEVLGISEAVDISQAVGDASRIWLIIFSQAIREFQDSGAPDHPHLVWLGEHYRMERQESWGDLVVILYER